MSEKYNGLDRRGVDPLAVKISDHEIICAERYTKLKTTVDNHAADIAEVKSDVKELKDDMKEGFDKIHGLIFSVIKWAAGGAIACLAVIVGKVVFGIGG